MLLPNGLRYLPVGGRGFCLVAGKNEARKMLENAAVSHTSGARNVGRYLKAPVHLLGASHQRRYIV